MQFFYFHQGPPRTIWQGPRRPLHKWPLRKSAHSIIGTCVWHCMVWYMVDGPMHVSIKRPMKAELDNNDVLTCHCTGVPVPSMRWDIIDGETKVWNLGTGRQLAVRQMCLYRQWMWDVGSSSITLRCTATRLNYTAYCDVNVSLAGSESDKIVCGMFVLCCTIYHK